MRVWFVVNKSMLGLPTADEDMTIQNILDCCPTKAALNVVGQMRKRLLERK